MRPVTRHHSSPQYTVTLLVALAAACTLSPTGSNKQAPAGYSGTWSGGQSSGVNLSGPMTFTITAGVIAGDVSPISGSTRVLSGNVSASGSFTASIPAGLNGCAVSFTGQVTTTSSTAASATGTYSLVSSQTCNHNSGVWSATQP
jgi:hypothetical protein